jgi:hypothetical protein
MTEHDDATAGIRLAQAAITAMADNVQAPDRGDQAALAVLNRCGSTGEAVWAAAYLLGGLRERLFVAARGNPHRVARAFRAVAADQRDLTETLTRLENQETTHE